MRLTTTIPLALLAALSAAAAAPRAAQPRAAAPLTIEQLIDIKHPSNPVWSRDSSGSRSRGSAPALRIFTSFPPTARRNPVQITTDGVPGNVFWSPDSKSLLFFRGGTAAHDAAARRQRRRHRASATSRAEKPECLARRNADRLPGAAEAPIRVRSLVDDSDTLVATVTEPVADRQLDQ